MKPPRSTRTAKSIPNRVEAVLYTALALDQSPSAKQSIFAAIILRFETTDLLYCNYQRIRAYLHLCLVP